MTDDNIRDDAAPDIAWLRNLAEEGRQAPMRGASILTAAGLIFGSASLFIWACLIGVFPIDAAPASLAWGGATLVFLATLVVLTIRMKRSGGVVTAANRAVGAVWNGVGWGIFAMGGALFAGAYRLGAHGGVAALWLLPSIVMVFYGVGWAVTAAMFKSRPLGMLAIASFVAAPILALLTGAAVQTLAYALCLFGLMALPGLLLMRQARRA